MFDLIGGKNNNSIVSSYMLHRFAPRQIAIKSLRSQREDLFTLELSRSELGFVEHDVADKINR